MEVSRRSFLGGTAAAATCMGIGIENSVAAPSGQFDLSMMMPDGAIRLNFNENALGPSSLAIAGAEAGIKEGYRYAIGGFLKPLLAEYHDIDKDWILMGTGSTELQRLAPISHLQDGGNVVTGTHTWDGGYQVAKNMGREVKHVPLIPEKGYSFDIDRMMDAVDADTKIFMVVTPNNPTGAVAPYDELKKVADNLPEGVLFVIDEAYADYLPDGWKNGLDLIKEGYKNVLITRTFSKAQAMAGFRVGYGIGHPDILSKITKFGCGPGSISMVTFGAVQGALQDIEHTRKSRAHVESCRNYFESEAAKLGITTVAGVPPFILLEMGDRSDAIVDELKKQKIFINYGRNWGLNSHIRISYGLKSENEAFFKAFKELI
ncbi:pyridoxal phosphate-dependent aminotransferase [Pseudemcibacter aquimaris]|uniref:pyridoxal phosphate-dependent aminotransferase n=1 Tax=Pseudemcibacter aquimaris TaxID=2857064 RepID=UPI002010E366|nr:histidinol-phosphate transaminase [Pseudemcibacter aquimaris]MCC3860189.1 aminotransferase class I/II-fold pyridoxal phosphate-dependent enzyme [Pseudemcibacter aquimaris]WDU60255.1 aminotransferase class I/II-fold pyridoxal phosphate-dependent enzyme [Pseudemcibacter aquimaris]